MPSDVIEPEPDATDSDPNPTEIPLSEDARASLSPSSTSSDDLTASLIQARPDPLLGAFEAQPSTGPPGVQAEVSSATPAADVEEKADTRRAEAMNSLAAIHVEPDDRAVANAAPLPPAASIGPFAGLTLSPPLVPIDQPSAIVDPGFPRAEAPRPVSDEDDTDAPDGMSLGTLVLLSYASAVTLGLFWVLWTGRRIRDDVSETVPVADARPDPGRRADQSRRVAPPKPIPAGNIVELGQTVRLGRIDATPLAVVAGPVELERNFTKRETRSGGVDALRLTLRLKNVSNDVVLAPFDEAFVRRRDHADPDSYIEVEGGVPIPMYPLAVESEWAILGQSFRELRPGETLETVVVSAPDVVSRLADAMTWRVRLRTDLNHTDDLGVRFLPADVKRGS